MARSQSAGAAAHPLPGARRQAVAQGPVRARHLDGHGEPQAAQELAAAAEELPVAPLSLAERHRREQRVARPPSLRPPLPRAAADGDCSGGDK